MGFLFNYFLHLLRFLFSFFLLLLRFYSMQILLCLCYVYVYTLNTLLYFFFIICIIYFVVIFNTLSRCLFLFFCRLCVCFFCIFANHILLTLTLTHTRTRTDNTESEAERKSEQERRGGVIRDEGRPTDGSCALAKQTRLGQNVDWTQTEIKSRCWLGLARSAWLVGLARSLSLHFLSLSQRVRSPALALSFSLSLDRHRPGWLTTCCCCCFRCSLVLVAHAAVRFCPSTDIYHRLLCAFHS